MSEATAKECELLGPLGIIVQVVLGVGSFAILVVKRYVEKPRRPWNIWALDSSKQAISQAVAHWTNMLLAFLLSEGEGSDNCDWYFINITVDVIFGVLIAYMIVYLLTLIGAYYELSVSLSLSSLDFELRSLRQAQRRSRLQAYL